ncbi:MAG: hypothetical protein K1X78_13150 [Verrucomicrobiaceae bacterium]|nr:hypothetical protein [Verrucomicrobiaceae bacterium]
MRRSIAWWPAALLVRSLQRRPTDRHPLIEASVGCAEDIAIAKLEWYRLSGENSDRQWSDILGVLQLNQGKLDLFALTLALAWL